jgi:hypothetical protein
MPSTLSWVFDMGNDYGVARSGSRQHIFPGDQVQNVAKGETATIKRIEGAFLYGYMMIVDSEEKEEKKDVRLRGGLLCPGQGRPQGG